MENLRLYINSLRHDFSKQSLSENDVNKNAIVQFEQWFKEAVNAKVNEPNAMTVCTATKEGKPSARILLLRNFDENGFVFYTNYDSRKGHEIEANPYCSILFFWPELERQIRIEGKIEVAPAAISDEYFALRPRTSRIGACASPQSKVLKNRQELEKLVDTINAKYTTDVPRPKNWGGFILKANYYEFWQGRQSRLHDRICYNLKNKKWVKQRLAP